MNRQHATSVVVFSTVIGLSMVSASCDNLGDAGPDAAMTVSDMSHVITPGNNDMAMAMTGDDMAAPTQGPDPIVVDDHWAASGYWPDGHGISENAAGCPMRAGQQRGKCHQFNYVNNPGGAGIFWQSPANNWGDKPGFDMPTGYAQVRFYAWGASGGETLSFQAGLGVSVDGFKQSLRNVTLSTTPKEIVLGINGAYRDQLVSAFEFGAGGVASMTFYIDDIVIVGNEDETAPAVPIASQFSPSGYFAGPPEAGAGNYPKDTPADCTPPTGGDADCHHFVWTRADNDAGLPLGTYAGVVWVPNNNGPAVTLDTNLREVRFWAWSKNSDIVDFSVGGTDQPFDNELLVKLSPTPKLYSIGVGNSFFNPVSNGFVWAGVAAEQDGTPRDPNGVDFFIDAIQWR